MTQDYWAGRFAPAQERNEGGGRAMYRRCLQCGGHALPGSESAHVRWCDADRKLHAQNDADALRVQIEADARLQAWRERGVL